MFKGLSVNFHLWQECNMSCGYCFNHNHALCPELPLQLRIVKLLCDAGFSKISFVGGEPTLCPWLSDLVLTAKERKVTTMLITNGKLLRKQNLSLFDWIGLSIDSFDNAVNKNIGRVGISNYHNLCSMIKLNGCRLKINTVVSKYNLHENFNDNISKISPERWKVLQVLKINDQNSDKVDKFLISDKECLAFLNKHTELSDIMCPESNYEMTNSYIMMGPSGCFIDNSTGGYIKSDSILDVGVVKAINQINFDLNKLINRKGIYNWGDLV